MEATVGDEPVEQLYDRAELRYVPRNMANAWVRSTNDLRNDTTFTPELRKQFIVLRRRIIKALQAGGAGIVLGSDSPQLWNAPGFSLNRELQSYVAAGLTPWQALATGTRNIARFLGNETEAGTIAVGKRADLILLEANPLADIRNVARKAGVMIGGKWLAKDEIERQLATLVVR